jgi:putative Mg2+ transporter-C (MgtC) family protein
MQPADTLVEIVIRIVAAVACGGLLGWERERHNRPAGLRTHMMVALGGAAFTMLALTMFHATLGKAGADLDPLRVVQGVVGGIGFLGAGTIIQSRGSVKGVTTAATIWVVGSIGVACGGGFYAIALTTVVAAYLILTAIGRIEGLWLGKRGRLAEGEEEIEN